MNIIRQSFFPKIKLSSFSDSGFTNYYTFDVIGNTGRTLLSYNFSKSIESISGSFSFSFEEVTGSKLSFDSGAPAELVMDKIKALDLVSIYEHDSLVFLGVVTDISFSATSGNVQKRVQVKGKSIEYLFEILQVSLDVTAMSFANSEALNVDLKDNLCKQQKDSDGTRTETALSIEEGLNTAFDSFRKVVETYKEVSSVQILQMIDTVYGSSKITDYLDSQDLSFLYPISSNLYSDSTIKFVDFLRHLLPSPVYEIYGYIENEKPKLAIREAPFDKSVWIGLKRLTISPDVLTSYSFNKSCAEVYTTFLSYIEGSLIQPDFYKRAYATEAGYESQAKLPEKIAKYGYRPMEVTFIGFYTGRDDKETKRLNTEVAKKMKSLNERLREWYGNLDEMYSGTITFVNVDYQQSELPGIGGRVAVGKNEFYVKQEQHDWQYNAAPTITYNVDRGGQYMQDGSFVECSAISAFMGEFEKI